MKVYVAARYARMVEMRKVHEALRAAGHEPTSRWVDGAEETKTESSAAALMDLVDVGRSDALLFYAEPEGSLNRGGGRWFELGYAYYQGLHCVAIQPPPAVGEGAPGALEAVFLHLPRIEVFSTLDEALDALAPGEFDDAPG